MNHIFFTCSSVERHLGCFQFLAIKNKAPVNIVELVSLGYDWTSLGYMPGRALAGSWGRSTHRFLRNCHIDFQSGIAGSWGRLIPSLLKNCHTNFQNGVQVCTPTSNGGVFPLPPSLQHELSLGIFILAIQTGIRWNFRVILICISLMAKGTEHLLTCFSAIWDSSVENSV